MLSASIKNWIECDEDDRSVITLNERSGLEGKAKFTKERVNSYDFSNSMDQAYIFA